MLIDRVELELLEKRRLVKTTSHPDHEDVILINYTDLAQRDQFVWREHPIINSCRGLVLSKETGQVLARPFKKFWNIGDRFAPKLEDFSNVKYVECTTKMDGSLGILVCEGPFKEKPIICTRGSFTSSQAIKATQMWNALKIKPYDVCYGQTYLFEIIYSDNRIVVDYGQDEKLVLIGLVANNSGWEHGHGALVGEGRRLGLPIVERWDITEDLDKFLERKRSNFEGYVLSIPDRQIRAKVKFEEYVKLHHVVFHLCEKYLWELMPSRRAKDEKEWNHWTDLKAWDGVLKGLSQYDEDWARDMIARLETSIHMCKEQLDWCIGGIEYSERTKKYLDRKQKAAIIIKEFADSKSMQNAAFALLDSKDWWNVIHKSMEPKGRGEVPPRHLYEEFNSYRLSE